MAKQPLIILIRDGWGYRAAKDHNAVVEAGTLYTQKLKEDYPSTLLDASGEAVGLPKGYMGNSEVGHITIGSGRIILQSLEKINHSIKDKSFFSNESFLAAITNAKEKGTSLHLIGLVQKEGVHSHLNHLFALLDLCKQESFSDVKIHAITDGRDAPVTLSESYINELELRLKKLGFGEVVTVNGRYFAMDRDKRWDRTQKAYDAIVLGKSEEEAFSDVKSLLKKCHEQEETDEFIKPRIKKGYSGFREDDSVVFFNFRTDRPRQLTQAIVEVEFDGFKRKKINVCYVAMTKYYNPMNALIAFSDEVVSNTLGEIISNNGLSQLRISETEKYAHVTFFFNAEREEPYKGEERILIPSPKVSTYDLSPEMKAQEITDKLLEQVDKDSFDVYVVNLVNGDMVGHTGVHDACIKAVRSVDGCVEQIVEKALEKEGTVLIFADHGNIEDQTDKWRTSHTTNKVPFILVNDKLKRIKLHEGRGLQDIAPTVLSLLEVQQPLEMTGQNILRK